MLCVTAGGEARQLFLFFYIYIFFINFFFDFGFDLLVNLFICLINRIFYQLFKFRLDSKYDLDEEDLISNHATLAWRE